MKSNKKQANRTALITGAARRIGAAIARALHQAGFDVALHCHQNWQAAQVLADECNAQRSDSAKVFIQDLRAEEAGSALIQDVIAWSHDLDVLVNNASGFIKDEALCNYRTQQELYTLNVLAPWALSLAAAPYLTTRSGVIINMTDIHANRALKGYTGYCQTKAALSLQTKALARSLAPAVRVNAVAPGAIAWPEAANALSDAAKKVILEKTLLKRHGDPNAIAHAVLALIENPFITGQTLAVDGGRSV